MGLTALQASLAVGTPWTAESMEAEQLRLRSTGKFTKKGAMLSVTVMSWSKVLKFPQASWAFQVRVMRVPQARVVLTSTREMVTAVQPSVATAEPLVLARTWELTVQPMTRSRGRKMKVGAVVSVTLIFWA